MTSIEKTTCRLCFSTSDDFINIFSDEDSDGLTSIGRMIVDCLLSELEPNTGYPEIVCQLCQLQLKVFYEFKKKVFLNHEKFASILNRAETAIVETKTKPSAPTDKTSSKITGHRIANKKCHRSAIKVEKPIAEIERIELPGLVQAVESLKSHNELKRRNECDDTNEEDADAKFIKLEIIDEEMDDLFKDDVDEIHDETEHYLEEQYLDNVSETEDHTEVEYVFEDELDVENSEDHIKNEHVVTDQDVKKLRKPKTPKVKKFLTERVLDADTMKEYDAVKCLNCNEYFETMDKFTTHYKACDKTACRVCGKMLSSNGMDLHLKQHNSEKPYACALCSKGFTTAQQCADHEFRHKNQRPFECNICQKTFKMKCDLRTHIMCHQDIRKHACPICGKRFRMRSHVTAHLETHNENNDFECTECGLMLKTSSSLKGHISQMHSTSYKHNCSICSRGFAKLDRFKRHMKTHEKKRVPTSPSTHQYHVTYAE